MFQKISQSSLILLCLFVLLFSPSWAKVELSKESFEESSGKIGTHGEKRPSLRILIIPTDNQIKAWLGARERLKALDSSLARVLEIGVLSFRREEVARLKEEVAKAELLVINLMGREAYQALKEDIGALTARGGRAIGLYSSGSYDEEMKRLGIISDPIVEKYNSEGGEENFRELLLYLLKTYYGFEVEVRTPKKVPEVALLDCEEERLFERVEDYYAYLEAKFPERLQRPWVALSFYKSYYTSGNTGFICQLAAHFRKEGFEVLPFWGFPPEKGLKELLLPAKKYFPLRALLALSFKVGVIPERVKPLLESLDLPLFNLLVPYQASLEDYKKSALGLDFFERVWQVFTPELIGLIAPTVIATKEKVFLESGEYYLEEKLIEERAKALIAKVKAYVRLQEKANGEKRIALIYYNYPPGKQNIGAAYLNVPHSIWQILKRLKAEGYDLGEAFEGLGVDELLEKMLRFGRNVAIWAPSEIREHAKSSQAVLIPLKLYKQWFEELPEPFRRRVLAEWGPPEGAQIMTYEGSSGEKYILLPALRFGKILLTVQPSRALEQDLEKAYHSPTIPPHHQYIAFYLWLRKEFKADAVIHLGTHGTHEWLPGREVGFLEEDDPEVLLGELPNIYPYIVDDVGEGLQAKRRGMAVIIDHLTPPLKKSTLNPDLRRLRELISEYKGTIATKGEEASSLKLEEIAELAERLNLWKELSINREELKDRLDELEDYLSELEESLNPFGLHTFGRPHEVAEGEELFPGYGDKVKASAERELENLVRALAGRYVPSGQGNDPVRNPESLPTGKNFYAFDPSKIPSPKTYELGSKLAEEFVENYLKEKQKYPEKVAFVLWAVETIRHEGLMEAKIMHLLGVKPLWDERGRVIGLTLIPKEELKRPRIEVVLTISGLYRDLFSNLVRLLDRAIQMVMEGEEEQNLVRQSKEKLKEALLRLGLKEEMAEKLSRVRIFSTAPGNYGTRLDTVISASGSWERDTEVAEVYLRHMSYPYGAGFWGEEVKDEGGKPLQIMLFSKVLSGTEVAIHSRATKVFATLDNDDYFQYLGGLSLAIRALDGKAPDAFIAELSEPGRARLVTLARFMGQEMKTRYLNPSWIEAMLKEGYAGARFVDKVVEHLFGFQVTNPEVVDSKVWQAFYEVYVEDKYGLRIKEAFAKAKNLYAYQSILGRMLEAVRKGYYQAEREVLERLTMEYVETIKKIGLACCEHTCNNLLLRDFVGGVLESLPKGRELFRAYNEAFYALKGGNPLPRAEERVPDKAPGKGIYLKPNLIKGYKLEEQRLSQRGEGRASGYPFPILYFLIYTALSLIFLLGFIKEPFSKLKPQKGK